MIGRIWSIIVKEFIQIRRDPRTLAIVLVMPLMQLILFGYAINTTVDHISTVVLDESHDAQSHGFIQSFFNTGYFERVGDVSSIDAMRVAIDSGVARVGFIIPPQFGGDLVSGRGAQAQIIIDGSDPSIAQTAMFVAGTISQAKAVEIQLTRSTSVPLPIELRANILYNPGLQSINFMIPGLIGLILQFQTLILTSFAVVRERERGTLEQLVVTPIRSWELLLGKILPFVLIGFINVLMASGLGVFWFGITFAGSFALLLLLSLVFVLSSLGIGLLISTVSRTQGQAMQLALFVMLPSIVLSGFVFPRESMPIIVRELGRVIPLTYFLRILRGIILKGVGLEFLWPDALLLAILGVSVFALSSMRFRKTMD